MSKNNKWEVRYGRSAQGGCPVCDFMYDLKREDRKIYLLVRTKVMRHQSYPVEAIIDAEDLEDIGDNLWELKISVATIHLRMLGSLDRTATPPVFTAVHAFKKKTKKLRKNEIKTAINRLATHK